MFAMEQMELIDQFKTMKQLASDLAQAIREGDKHRPAELADGCEGMSARNQVASHVQEIWYSRDQNTTLLGALEASERTLELVQALNEHKDQFKQQVLALRALLKTKGANIMRLLGQPDGTRDPDVDEALVQAGMSRLNLTLCYRHMKILPEGLVSISWTEAKNVRAIKKLTVKEAIEYAQARLQEPTLSVAINLLSGLNEREEVAIVRDIAPAFRANLVWRVEGDSHRKMVQAHSPLFYPGKLKKPVRLRFPHDRVSVGRRHRNDQKLNETPLVDVLNLYTYRAEPKELVSDD